MVLWTRVLLAGAGAAALAGAAIAQAPTVAGSASPPAAATAPAASATPAVPAYTAPAVAPIEPMGSSDAEWLRQGLAAAKSGDFARAQAAQTSLSNPVARKIVLWAIIDQMPDRLSFFQLDQARKDLWGWPRKASRQAAAERQLEAGGLGPQKTIDWFEGAEPATAEGAMALASAYQQTGKTAEAQALIRRFWREKSFEADVQRTMLARFGSFLTMDDHIRRADTLLYGPQGPAARDMVALLPPDQQALAAARIALHNGARDADSLYAEVPEALRHDPGLAVERARWMLARGDAEAVLPLLADFPTNPGEDAAGRMWSVRRQLVNLAIKTGDYRSAYRAVDQTGMTSGADAADAEFLAGWIALTRLHDATAADGHFAKLEKIGASPITRGRAFYWRGRAREAMGDATGAKNAYLNGALYNTTFYGQLAAAKAGQTELVLDKDPQPSAADRARFDGREIIQAARMLADAGQMQTFNSLVTAAADSLPDVGECGMLVDMIRGYGLQDLSMRVVRLCAQRGFVLTERGYPVRTAPPSTSVEAAMVLGITRQESGFDPRVRSGVGARGMMQLMPATAKVVARRNGISFSPDRLDDADYNMTLGTSFLGQLVNEFSGSYLMAAAAYNAGPGRPIAWISTCGDPRTGSVDPVDYIECIPISETRNYVMRVLEGMQVYRARLNGGRAPLTLPADLKRGGYGGSIATLQLASNGSIIDALLEGSLGDPDKAVASTPVPNPPESEAPPPRRETHAVKGHLRGEANEDENRHGKGKGGKSARGGKGKSGGSHASKHASKGKSSGGAKSAHKKHH